MRGCLRSAAKCRRSARGSYPSAASAVASPCRLALSKYVYLWENIFIALSSHLQNMSFPLKGLTERHLALLPKLI